MTNEETTLLVKKSVDSLQRALNNLARIPSKAPSQKQTSDAKAKSADNDKAGEPLERVASTYGENEEALVRRAVKILSSIGRVQQQGGDSVVSSSKTD